MAKQAFFAAALVALVALSDTKRDITLQLQCQRELHESSLDACQQVVDQQLAVQQPFFLPRSIHLRTGVMRAHCCQELRDISRECRAAAIRQIVRQYEHQALVPLREDPSYSYPGEDEEEQEGGPYYPGETYPQPEKWWEQQQEQGRQAFPHQHQPWWRQPQQGQGWYHPSQTYRPQQHQQGSYHQQSQQTGFRRLSSAPHFGAKQQAARLRAVAKVRQVAAQLPAMCWLVDGSAFSASGSRLQLL